MCSRPFFCGGNLDSAIATVREQPHLQSHFHFYAGCCTWYPQQLDKEIQQGYWIPVKTHADRLVSIQRLLASHRSSTDQTPPAGTAAASAAAAVGRAGENSHASSSVQKLHDQEQVRLLRSLNTSDADLRLPAGVRAAGASAIANAGRADSPYGTAYASGPDDRDVWRLLLNRLPGPYNLCTRLPRWVSAGSIESLDWQSTE